MDAFSPDTTRLFSNLIAISINLEENVAKRVKLMFDYYGGVCASEMSENCTHAIATSYDAVLFDNLKAQTSDRIKFVTPDWITDCIDNNSLVDHSIYNPKYLVTNSENQILLDKRDDDENEMMCIEPSVTINPLINENQNKQNTNKPSRNYVIEADKFFNQNSTHSDSINQIINKNSENKADAVLTLNQLPQTPNSKTKGKKSRGANRVNSATQPTLSNQQTTNKNKNGQTNTTTSSNFNFDMNEIFQSVIGEAMSNSLSKPKPILLELIENKNGDLDVVDGHSAPLFSLYNETYCTQENSHLIKFNNCLLGCVFYLRTFEDYYSADTLSEWLKMIENYGGRVVDDYSANVEQITHVLCSNRNSDVYKEAANDEKRIVTQFWLEDVLEEEKLKPPWRAYHFPSVFDRENGPLKNHVI